MRLSGGSSLNSAVQTTETLSTGHTVELPVRLRATMLGATFAAPTSDVLELLPSGLYPIRATPTGDAAVTLLSVEYHEVGIPGLDPYNEFAVVIPAHHSSPSTVPYVSALLQATNGYVWSMPVTTEPTKAFGIDIWGFPKVVAEITHDDDGSVRTTTVTMDGDRFVTLEVDRPPSIDMNDDGFSYTIKDNNLLKVPNKVDAAAGIWPFSSSVSVSFGDHPKAGPLRNLNLGSRALARVVVDGNTHFHPGERV
ncbi:acetoacetate decarboxylase [Halorubrum sp. BOL3-1]|nr:acetoacetate decarboxylase [Halorubrum sp. BOL3-1]